jgi:hypothetical protein
MYNKFLSTVLAACMITPPFSMPIIALGSAIAINAIAVPAQASKFTKVKEFVKKVCEIGGCFWVVEQVVEYFETPQDVPSSSNNCSGKGCSTIRTGGNAVKVGETRTIIRKVRIR